MGYNTMNDEYKLFIDEINLSISLIDNACNLIMCIDECGDYEQDNLVGDIIENLDKLTNILFKKKDEIREKFNTVTTTTKNNEEIKQFPASIEYETAQNEITKYQAFTKMKQIVFSLIKENERINKDLENYIRISFDFSKESEYRAEIINIRDGTIKQLQKRNRKLEKENEELKEYKAMYEGLCK